MAWATRKEVFKHYRMLLARDAYFRQTLVSGIFAVFLLALGLIHKIISIFISAALFASFNHLLLSLFRKRDSFVGEQKVHAKKIDKSTDDVPQFFDTIQDNEPLFPWKQVLSKSLFALSSIVPGLALALFFHRTPGSTCLHSALFVTYSLMNLALFSDTLDRLSGMEAPEFPSKRKDRFLEWVRRTFLPSKGYYFIGTVDGKPIGLPRLERFMHTLITGPTGEGKSSSLIIPPLLMDAMSPGSAVVPDAKSPELYHQVAGKWIKEGKQVFLFDPWHPGCIGINPLPEADDQDLLTMVEVLMREREEEMKDEAFFRSRTKYLLFAILRLAQTFNDRYCNLATVYHLVESVETLSAFYKSAGEITKRLFSDFEKLTNETRVNAITSIRAKLDIFMDENVRKAFSSSEFPLNRLFFEKEPCLLVIGAPIDQKEPGTKISSLLINLIINLAFRERRLQKTLKESGERSFTPNDLYLYLDELRNLKITALADLVSIARETRTHVIGSVTDLGFFKYYRSDFSGLMANFRTQLYFRGLDFESAKYISQLMGQEDKVSYRLFRGLMASKDQTYMMTPEEIHNLPPGKLLAFTPKTNPFVADRRSIYESRWLDRFKSPPPANLRNLYEDWDMENEELRDMPLPRTGEHYDLEAMRDGCPRKERETSIKPEKFHYETGGGRVRIGLDDINVSGEAAARRGGEDGGRLLDIADAAIE